MEKLMRNRFRIFAVLIALAAVPSLAQAQTGKHDAVNQPGAKQSAPANAPDASGHDAQTGKPETGERAASSRNNASDHQKHGQQKSDSERK
jgi:hypothetical protein